MNNKNHLVAEAVRVLREGTEVGHPTPELQAMPHDHDQVETPFTEEELNHIAHIHRGHAGRHYDRIEELKNMGEDHGNSSAIGNMIDKHRKAAIAHHNVTQTVRYYLRQMHLSHKYGSVIKTPPKNTRSPVSSRLQAKPGGEDLKAISDYAFKRSRKAVAKEREYGFDASGDKPAVGHVKEGKSRIDVIREAMGGNIDSSGGMKEVEDNRRNLANTIADYKNNPPQTGRTGTHVMSLQTHMQALNAWNRYAAHRQQGDRTKPGYLHDLRNMYTHATNLTGKANRWNQIHQGQN